MDRADSNFLQRCDEVRCWSGTRDDRNDGSRELPHLRRVYETDLGGRGRQRPISELGTQERGGAHLYSGSPTVVGDTGVAEMIPDQWVRHVSERNLSGRSESGRPRVSPPSRMEHGQNPEIDRVNIHPV